MDKSLLALGIMFGLILALGMIASVSAEVSNLPQSSCAVNAPFYCLDGAVSGNGITLSLKNMGWTPLDVKNITIANCGMGDNGGLGWTVGASALVGESSGLTVNCGQSVGGNFEGNIVVAYKTINGTNDTRSLIANGVVTFRNNSNNCTAKEDCYPAGFEPSACGTFYSCIEGKCAIGSNACAVNNTNNTRCRTLYWIDNNNKNCDEQKEFCGTYLRPGLFTFATKENCLKAVNNSERNFCTNDEDCKVTSCGNCIGKDQEQMIFCERPVIEPNYTISCKCKDNGCVSINKIKEKLKNKFMPWQKRNESECPDGCKCRGAVVSCVTEDGKTMTIEAGNSGKTIVIEINNTKISTNISFETETNNETNRTKIILNLPDGRNITLKILPERAAERAMEKLGKLNFTIELKEVTVTKGNQTRVFYFFDGEKHGKFLGLFKMKAKVFSEIDAETGEVVKVKKPWWGFLAGI